MSKVWFITGAQSGIGLEIARAALADGERVVATALEPAIVTSHLGSSERLLTARLDVTDEARAQVVVAEAVAAFGTVDVLVNNAGIAMIGAVEECSDAEVRRILEVNFFGTMNVTRAVLPIMRERRAGHVINIASVYGRFGDPGMAAYCASKHAVVGMSECLYHEVKNLGIRVTVVEPGLMRTPIHEATFHSQLHMPEYVTRRRTPIGEEPGNPQKLAAAILQLAQHPHPPLHFLAGVDAVRRMAIEQRRRARDFDAWKNLIMSLDYDAPAQS